ncbi:MAG TPA: o-succinylbenzoate synthase, partial [Cyanobacteria bacterium UBA11370]|nr:o-succinylbenzoate synthase [Cyanobacteria bacterium UBA11370]
IGWGEIAPLPWFGSETLEQALNFCHQLPTHITVSDIFSIPARLPACQFGFESALESVGSGEWGVGSGEMGEFLSSQNLKSISTAARSAIPNSNSKIAFSYLLPTGEAALESWQIGWNQGYRTFKWKMGVATFEEELKVFDRLVQLLPPSAKLRLDANGGLSIQEAERWLKISDDTGIIEFIEQPISPKEFNQMLKMSNQYSTPIALDESVATLSQLEECYDNGWRGIYVIKAAIAGSPKRLRQFCQTHDIDIVFSSVFETAIGRHAALQLAAKLSNRDRAVGFGINHWFTDDE